MGTSRKARGLVLSASLFNPACLAKFPVNHAQWCLASLRGNCIWSPICSKWCRGIWEDSFFLHVSVRVFLAGANVGSYTKNAVITLTHIGGHHSVCGGPERTGRWNKGQLRLFSWAEITTSSFKHICTSDFSDLWLRDLQHHPPLPPCIRALNFLVFHCTGITSITTWSK